MLDIRHPELRPYAFEGNFGLEREALRVLAFEAEKVYHPEKRYAWMEACHV